MKREEESLLPPKAPPKETIALQEDVFFVLPHSRVNGTSKIFFFFCKMHGMSHFGNYHPLLLLLLPRGGQGRQTEASEQRYQRHRWQRTRRAAAALDLIRRHLVILHLLGIAELLREVLDDLAPLVLAPARLQLPGRSLPPQDVHRVSAARSARAAAEERAAEALVVLEGGGAGGVGAADPLRRGARHDGGGVGGGEDGGRARLDVRLALGAERVVAAVALK